MAMSQKHFETAAHEAGKILSEIKGHDLALCIILRADVAEAMVRVIEQAAQSDTDTRFDRKRFERAMWASAAAHDTE